jgi:hypothetical protein
MSLSGSWPADARFQRAGTKPFSSFWRVTGSICDSTHQITAQFPRFSILSQDETNMRLDAAAYQCYGPST